MFFLQELKVEGMIVYKYIPGPDNKANIFTKNVDTSKLHTHCTKLCRYDDLPETFKGN